MSDQRGGCRPGGRLLARASACLALAILSQSCRRSGDPEVVVSGPSSLRIGVAQASSTNPAIGLRQLSQLLTNEGLARAGEDGRMQSSLADTWTSQNAGRSLQVKLRP